MYMKRHPVYTKLHEAGSPSTMDESASQQQMNEPTKDKTLNPKQQLPAEDNKEDKKQILHRTQTTTNIDK